MALSESMLTIALLLPDEVEARLNLYRIESQYWYIIWQHVIDVKLESQISESRGLHGAPATEMILNYCLHIFCVCPLFFFVAVLSQICGAIKLFHTEEFYYA